MASPSGKGKRSVANILKREKQVQVLHCLVEGLSVRATARITGVDKNTILSLLVRVGEGCGRLHDRLVQDVDCRDVQLDEIWTFVGKKQPRLSEAERALGTPRRDQYTFVGLDRETKLVLSCLMRRFTRLTNAFSKKLRNLKAAVALHFAWYNFGRIHQSLDVTPAMEAGIADRVWEMGDLLEAVT